MAARKNRKSSERAATPGDDDNATGLVRVKLTDDQWRERCDSLASLLKKKEGVEGKKAAAAAKFNGEIKLLDEKISQLADEVETREANVEAQLAMNYGGYAGKRQPADGEAPAPANDEAPTPAEPVEGAA